MQPAIHLTTTVLPDNRIEIDLPPGTAGQQVTVFVVLTNPEAATSEPSLGNHTDLGKIATDPNIQTELAALSPISTESAKRRSAVSAILARIRSRPRVNPLEFDLPDSTDLVREDRLR